MAKNQNGLDFDYFEMKLAKVTDDLHLYRPDELARELVRIAVAADKQVAITTAQCADCEGHCNAS